MAFGEITLVKEFSTEEAGQRVGWTSVIEVHPEEREPYVVSNVVVATVGENGAKLGYHPYERNGEIEKTYSKDCAEGFVAVAGLSVVISKTDGPYLDGGSVSFIAGDRNSFEGVAGTLLFGASNFTKHSPEEDDIHWGSSPEEVLANLQSGLTHLEVGEHYPTVYYLLNGYLGHGRFEHNRNADSYDIKMQLLPDPDMHDVTERHVRAADTIAKNLEAVATEDKRMKSRLTVFSDIPAADIPDAFTKSRRFVGTREQEVQTVLSRLLVPGLVYLPIGFRPSGRSWPYMDALEPTEERAFGPELASLQAGSVDRVNSELDRELKELEHRVKYADQGYMALYLLSDAEAEAATNK